MERRVEGTIGDRDMEKKERRRMVHERSVGLHISVHEEAMYHQQH